jgi:hypothetical protein
MPFKSQLPSGARDTGGDRARRIGWTVVLLAYLAVFGVLLLATDGRPYAIDNNESFSSLWHARHLFDVGFGQTKGLADEVFAWHRAASPYVHTHQGNFPRLFASLLYLFGARSIESQIVLTTLIVGLAAVWLAYRFLCTIGPPLFATVGCLVLVTDYGLFGQWQVDTYRVWYGFFFFSSLLWVSALERRRGWPIVALGALNFAAMFYGEYVFASFVGITAGAYALFKYPLRPRNLLRACAAVLAGGAAAGGVLLAQLVAYMGWPGVKLDLSYTLAARNMASDQSFTDKVDRFYRDHRVIFWHNYFDIANYRSVRAFGASLFQKHLQYYSPWVCLSAMVILAGALVGLFRRNAGDGTSGRAPKGMAARALLVGARSLSGVVLAGLAFAAIRYLRPLFDASSGNLWHAALGLAPPSWMGWLAFLVSSAVGAALAVAGTGRLVGRENRLVGLLYLSLSVAAAYAVAYRMFTGYIYSGYLNRQAPFLVFATDVLLAGALYIVLETTRRGFARALGDGSPAILPIAGSVLLALFLGAWSTLQLSYLIVVPPTGEPFLKLLSKAPFRGGTFVANDYPAPVAEKTHAWAYDESSIFSGHVKLTPDGFQVEHDRQYLWFADAGVNTSYMKPDFGILIDQPPSISQALTEFTERRSHPEHQVAFDTTGIIMRSGEPLQPFLRHQLVATDGHSYSIVRFDWDFPPYLRPVDTAMRAAALSMTFRQKLAFSEGSQEQRRRWRVAIEPTEVAAPGGPRTGPVLLAEASVDGRPVFSRDELTGAGWAPADARAGRNRDAWLGRPGRTGRLAAVVVGDSISIRFLEGPGRGAVKVGVNDMEQVIDLQRPVVAEHVISLNTAAPRDKYTAIPSPSPGAYVNTWLTSGTGGPVAVVGYRYAHQEGRPEEGTTVRVYNEPVPGRWQLADTVAFLGAGGIPVELDAFRRMNPDTLHEYARMRGLGETRTYEQWLADHLTANPGDRNRRGILDADPSVRMKSAGPANSPLEYRMVPLPLGLEGRIQISVTPGTRTKAGPEYFGQSFDAGRIGSAQQGRTDPVQVEMPRSFAAGDLPYGTISLRVRFPIRPLSGVEPIVSAGVEEAGDFVYVIYSDSTHIKIGFDHWFKGGPLSPPIEIDYAKVHDLEISMGSLFPPQEDIIFVGMSPEAVADIKGQVWVRLDGRTVIQAPSEFWDSPPTQVTIGRNDIKGTSSSPLFSGDILESKRTWPDLK